MKLAERYPSQHCRIDRNRKLAPIRQLDRDNIVDPEPEGNEMGREPLGATIILAVPQPYPRIDDRQLVRCVARPLFENVIAGRLHPIPFVDEPGDPSGVDRRVGDAHANSSFRHATVIQQRRYGTLLANRFKIG